MATVGENIKSYREKRGMSISRLARETGVSRQWIYDIEANNIDPTISKVIAVCEALDISIADVVSGTVDKNLGERVTELERQMKHLKETLRLISVGHKLR